MPYFNDSNLCSGELLSNKFLFPCDPELYLKFQYGDKWETPLENYYFNSKTFKFLKKWSDEEYPYSVRMFFYNGSIDNVQTLKEINKNSNITYHKLPEDIL